MTLHRLDVAQVTEDLRPIAQLRVTIEDLARSAGLTLTPFTDELGPGADAFVTDGQTTFRLCTYELDPCGPQVTVSATPGPALTQAAALLEGLGLDSGSVASLFNGKTWLTGSGAVTAA